MTPPAAPAIDDATRVRFRPLVVHREEGREPLLGCTDSRRFLEVDEETLLAVRLLEEGRSVGEAAAALRERLGDDADVAGLVRILAERGFVERLGEHALEAPKRGMLAFAWLNRVEPARLAWLRHPLAALAVAVVALWWAVSMVTLPTLRPAFSDFHVVPSPLLSTVLTFAALLAFGNLHELAHFLVARSYGVRSAVTVSHRFYILTLQTDVTNAWLLPRAAQLRIFLAGIGFNLVVAASAGTLAGLGAHGLVPLPAGAQGVLRWVAIVNTFPLLFQVLLFARTDLYYVLQALLGERNLARDALAYAKLVLFRAWWRVRRFPSRPCPTGCGGRLVDEPFCFRCGAAMRLRDPNSEFALLPAQRPRLRVFAPIMLAGQVLGYVYILFLLRRILAGRARAAAEMLWSGIVRPGSIDLDLLVTLGLYVATVALQLGIALFFLVQTVHGLDVRQRLSDLARLLTPPAPAARRKAEFTRLAVFTVVARRAAAPAPSPPAPEAFP